MDYFAQITLLASGAVLLVHQILKLKIVPLSIANRYPVPTNIILSVIAAVIAVWQTNIKHNTWTDWAILIGLISVVSAVAYNQLLGKWSDLKEMEG